MLISRADSYEAIYREFAWDIPEYFNIAGAVCDRHARDPEKVALIYETADGRVEQTTFWQLQRRANQWANVITALGLQRGDRVAIYLPVHPAVPIVHIGCWKAGLVSCPVAALFGVDGLSYRLEDSGARAIVTDSAHLDVALEARANCPELKHIFVIDGGPRASTASFWDSLDQADEHFETLKTRPLDPAYINYTSGTTGNPKGALAPHQAMLGHMPPFEYCYDFPGQPGDVIWSPADWSWLAGLMDVLMPALFSGIPVAVAEPERSFDASRALAFMARHQITLALLVPTMLKRIRQAPDIADHSLKLRAIASGGESVGADLLRWASTTLGAHVNEIYGQTECNFILVNNARLNSVKPGSLGLPAPGFNVAVVNAHGEPAAVGEEGQIACQRPHPIMLLKYWKNPTATKEKYSNDWLLTGDLGHVDEDGYFWFHGRADDIITSSGYRIGPGEIEEALMAHPAVAMAAAVGVPDPVRTEAVKAFVVLAAGHSATPALAAAIREMVSSRLARHEAPREIEFIKEIPMTVTGKILRRALRQTSQPG